MERSGMIPLSERTCSWARSVQIFGDKWSLLIIRDALAGVTKFSDFQQSIGVAKNILSGRLATLCDHGIMARVPQREGSSRVDYVLTPKGKELFPILIAIGQWGDKWVFGTEGEPVRVVDKATGANVQAVSVFSHKGQRLAADDVELKPGPGATDRSINSLKRVVAS